MTGQDDQGADSAEEFILRTHRATIQNARQAIARLPVTDATVEARARVLRELDALEEMYAETAARAEKPGPCPECRMSSYHKMDCSRGRHLTTIPAPPTRDFEWDETTEVNHGT